MANDTLDKLIEKLTHEHAEHLAQFNKNLQNKTKAPTTHGTHNKKATVIKLHKDTPIRNDKKSPTQTDINNTFDDMDSDRDRLYNKAVTKQIPIKSYQDFKKSITYDSTLNMQLDHGFKVGHVSPNGLLIDNNNIKRESVNDGQKHIIKDGNVYQFGNTKFVNNFLKVAKDQFKKGYATIAINSQGLIPIEHYDAKTDKTNCKFIAGPTGAKIGKHKMKPGEVTGTYKLGKKAAKELSNDFTFSNPKGVTTYVDPKSELIAINHLPENTTLIESKLDVSQTNPNAQIEGITSKNSQLKFNKNTWIKNADFINTKTNQSVETKINNSNLNNVNLNSNVKLTKSKVHTAMLKQSDIINSNITGGTINNSSKIKDSIIKQNVKSLITKSNLNKTVLFNKETSNKKLDSATTISHVNANNAVLYGDDKHPIVMLNSNIKNTYALNGLASQNSSFEAKTSKPLMLNNVEANYNQVKPVKFMTKLTGKLPLNTEITDKIVKKYNLPIASPDKDGAKELATLKNGHFAIRSFDKIVQNDAKAFEQVDEKPRKETNQKDKDPQIEQLSLFDQDPADDF